MSGTEDKGIYIFLNYHNITLVKLYRKLYQLRGKRKAMYNILNRPKNSTWKKIIFISDFLKENNLSNVRIDSNFLNPVKGMYKSPTAHTVHNRICLSAWPQ